MTAAAASVPAHFRTHDLLRLQAGARLVSDTPEPDWVADALAEAPWVVVRRARDRGELVPAGVRGGRRDQRWAAWLDPGTAVEHLAPEALTARLDALPAGRIEVLPALGGLARLRTILDLAGRPWGPAGSVGFELASGRPTVTAASDLDIVVRCDAALDRRTAAERLHALETLGVRCDVLLETPAGGVALAEWARTGGRVAARGPDGPRLVEDPWEAAA